MPIYEYKCRGCGHYFEALLRPPTMTKASCPSCHGEDLEQQLSAFAVNSEERSQLSFGKARKDNEKVIKEQKIAQAEEHHHHHHDHHH